MRLPFRMLSALLRTGTTPAPTSIRFRNDWKWEGQAAPLLMALDRGWYAEAGLDVAVDTGMGSREAIPRVAHGGNWHLGSADINSLIKFRDRNPDLLPTGVMMVYNEPPFAIIGRKSLGVTAPKDLEGKILGAPASDGAYAQWNTFARANGIDALQRDHRDHRLPGRATPVSRRATCSRPAGWTPSLATRSRRSST